jgi:hypothetical protein
MLAPAHLLALGPTPAHLLILLAHGVRLLAAHLESQVLQARLQRRVL